MISSGYDGCCYLRIYLPCVYNGWWTDKPSLREDRISIANVRQQLQDADVVVFHRAEEQTYHDLARILKVDGKKIVMDNDDTFRLEDFHPLAGIYPNGTKVDTLARRDNNLNEFIGLCDLVTTTTKTLAEEYKKMNPNVVILPNYIDPWDWPKPKRNEGNKVRIGIVGSTGFEYDYLHLKKVIRKLSKRDDVELILFGLQDLKVRKENPIISKVFKDEYKFWDSIKKTQFPWVHRCDYNKTLNETKLDIMLIPRKDNYFNRCKSNVKFLEAAMCEIPVIAQSFPDGPYEEITPDMGVLIKDNTKWEEEIERLIKDKELRRAMGKRAKEYVLKNYNIENEAHRWSDAYHKLYEDNKN